MNIVVPEKLSEITLKQYIDFDKANKEESESQFLIHRMINIFCGVDMRDCFKMPLEDAEEIASEIADVLNQTSKLKTTFEHKGVEYGLIPDLTQITLGEYVDLEEYLKETSSLHKAMAVLYRPVTKKYRNLYDIEVYESAMKHSEALLDMPCDIATSATLFFYNLSRELSMDSQVFLKTLELQNKQTQTSAGSHSSQKSTDGSRLFTAWLKETLQSIMK
jgi:hypothetical protein